MHTSNVLVITHIAFKQDSKTPVEGPYSSVIAACHKLKYIVEALELSLFKISDPILHGKAKSLKQFTIPIIIDIPIVKYIIDAALILFFSSRYILNKKDPPLIIAIDPLSCVPLLFLKKFLSFTLIFYSVEFSEKRFKNKLLQKIYMKADELSSRHSNQTWVICESLQEYKQRVYNTESIYVPNSVIFSKSFYSNGHKKRTGNKLAWTGTCNNPRQFTVLFDVLKEIITIQPSITLLFAPTRDHDKFEKRCVELGFKKFKILRLSSREEWQKYAATCDCGIAIYDERFGATKYIEPMKMWDFLLCGIPFIVSAEPSIATDILNKDVGYRLSSKNKISYPNELKQFLQKTNLKKLSEPCLLLAQKYDISKRIKFAIESI